MAGGVVLRAYDHRRQEWITGPDAVPVMLDRSRRFLADLIDRRAEYCRATRTPAHKIPGMIAELRREIALLEKLL